MSIRARLVAAHDLTARSPHPVGGAGADLGIPTSSIADFGADFKIVYNALMQHIGSHIKRTFSKNKETERGELMRFFCERINYDRTADGYPPVTMARMGKTLEKIPTKDLYYLKSVCEDSKHFSKKFWWLLNPKNHPQTTPEEYLASQRKK